MNEFTLAYLWKNQQFSHENLKLVGGETLAILARGQENIHAGADFQQAKVRINALLWVGAIEIHVKSSDWFVHKHQQDPSYENVILHVVWEYDEAIVYQNGQHIPCFCLQDFIDSKNIPSPKETTFACAHFFNEVPNVIKSQMLASCYVERLNEKIAHIETLFEQTNHHWEETSYQALAKSFGFSLNAEPMIRLAQSLPLSTVLRYRDRPNGIEAAMFGLAGLLEEPIKDEYQWELRREFIHLKKKHTWPETFLSLADWKLLRLRPSNFPAIRLAQFAEIVRSNCSLISLLLEINELKTLYQLFEIPLNEYWSKHYNFGKTCPTHHTRLGKYAFESICINTLIPLLCCYAQKRGNMAYRDKAMRWIEQIHAENNQFTRLYTQESFTLKHAGESQGCLHLHNHYCEKKRCQSCQIGQYILATPR